MTKLRSRSPGGCAGADAAVDELKKRLDATGAPYDLVVSSGCLDVDVLPRGANKGAALRFILEEAAEQAVAAAGCCGRRTRTTTSVSRNSCERFERHEPEPEPEHPSTTSITRLTRTFYATYFFRFSDVSDEGRRRLRVVRALNRKIVIPKFVIICDLYYSDICIYII